MEKNAYRQNSISEHNIHFLLQFRAFFGFVYSDTDQRFLDSLKKKKKKNQKVLLLDENLRNGGSVKTGIKPKKLNERTECLWPC